MVFWFGGQGGSAVCRWAGVCSVCTQACPSTASRTLQSLAFLSLAVRENGVCVWVCVWERESTHCCLSLGSLLQKCEASPAEWGLEHCPQIQVAQPDWGKREDTKSHVSVPECGSVHECKINVPRNKSYVCFKHVKCSLECLKHRWERADGEGISWTLDPVKYRAMTRDTKWLIHYFHLLSI